MATFNAIKGNAKSRRAMKNALDYVSQRNKTLYHDQELVSGHNCVARCAWDEMITMKHRWHKTDGVQFYHFVQSFSPEEKVTPEEVHAIGLELAQRLFPDFEVLVATHIDTDHLHSHLIVNSVSFVDGRKLHQNAGDLQRQRDISDAICAAHGLTVLEPAKKYGHGKGMSSKEYRSAAKGESWKFQLINTIDLCMRRTKSKKEFIREMEKRGYQVRWEEKRQAITYTTPTGMKCRDTRLHDKKYLKEAMDREFHIRKQIVLRGIEAVEFASRRDLSGSSAGACLSHTGAVGADDDLSGHPVSSGSPTARFVVEAERHDESDALRRADSIGTDGEAGNGHGGDDLSAPTGWEEERAEAFEATPDQSPGALSGLAVGHSDSGGVVGNVVRLGLALERTQQSEPVPVPSVTHGDRKAIAKEREKKINQGHKPNDHADPEQEMGGMGMS